MKKQMTKNKESSLEPIRKNIIDSRKVLERMRVAVANGLIEKKVYEQTEKRIASNLLNNYVDIKRVDFLVAQKSLTGKITLKKKLDEEVKKMLIDPKKKAKISKKIIERKKQILKREDKGILLDIPVLRSLFLRNVINQKEYVNTIESIEKEHELISKKLYDYMKHEDMIKLKRKINALIHRHLKKSLLKKETDELSEELSNLEILFENKLMSKELYESKCLLIKNRINTYENLASKINIIFDLYLRIVDSMQKETNQISKKAVPKKPENKKLILEKEKQKVIKKIKELTAD
ncbi:MAG: hypothetical protein KAQ92_08675 [Candidatus Aenigmarchaeota archaeon]|nr:hypothetical protein [Candidatus Aenigmarchaeota archaeon]